MIINKYTRISIGKALILADAPIVFLGLAFHNWKMILYSWIVVFITGIVVDIIMKIATTGDVKNDYGFGTLKNDNNEK